jgi:hypothetical protein
VRFLAVELAQVGRKLRALYVGSAQDCILVHAHEVGAGGRGEAPDTEQNVVREAALHN